MAKGTAPYSQTAPDSSIKIKRDRDAYFVIGIYFKHTVKRLSHFSLPPSFPGLRWNTEDKWNSEQVKITDAICVFVLAGIEPVISTCR